MGYPFGETITRLVAQTITDPYSGGTVPVWDDPAHPPAETPAYGVALEPRPSTEDVTEARNAVTTGFTAYLPPDSPPFTAANRVRIRGDVYQVLGDPAVWVSPFTGWAPGSVMQCERVTG